MTDDEVRNFCLDYISKHKKLTYFKFILEEKNYLQNILEWEKEKLKDHSFGHKLWWFVHEIHEFPICPVCGKQNLRKTRNYKCYPIEVGVCCCHGHANIYMNSIKKYGYYKKEEPDEITEEYVRQFCKNYIETKPSFNLKRILEKKKYIYFINNWEKEKLKDHSFLFKVHWFINKIHDFPKCKLCGKIITKERRDNCRIPYTYCSESCHQKDPEAIKSRLETCRKNNTFKKITDNRRKDVFKNIEKLKFVKLITNHDIFIKTGPCSKDLEWKCLKCNKTFKRYYNYWEDEQFWCPYCNPKIIGVSKQENELFNYIKKILPKNISIIKNCRSELKNPETNYPLELDIYIPHYKLAFEYNGDYWHSKEFDCGKSVKRDELKQLLCKEKSIHLEIINEHEWMNNRKNVQNNILEIIRSCSDGKNK